ncbi:hypothetical protein GOM49_12210 [Clostridium bovifaecis]|uniref:SbsA Ig-like domain-containing protein n=1 Tax=Clostridium bovifaecis TaxID=2184719 RepID=A0A6I6ETR7_9CLOT|nr:hypothetical protein GOM49_12210 [Clostridium bovifaecis]
MKIKKIISLLVVYLYLFTFLPIGFLVEKVQALEGYGKYDSDSTIIENKYDIKEDILKVKQYEDYSVVLTGQALYFIQDGKAKKYDLGKVDIFPNTNIERQGKYIYLSPYRKNSTYKILTIDSEKFEGQSNSISEYISYDDNVNNIEFKEAIVDSNNNKWFSVHKSSEDLYELLKVEGTSATEVKAIASLKGAEGTHYDDAFRDLKIDSSGSAWFKVTESNSEVKKYMLARIYKDGTDKTYTFGDEISSYAISNDGSVWIVSKDKLVHVEENGNAIKEFKDVNIKDITIDSKGNVWVLEEDKVKEIVNDELKEKYTVLKSSNEISVNDEGSIILKNTRGFTLINKGKIEHTYVNSYVNNSALVLKDNVSDIRIISSNYKNGSKDKDNTDDLISEVTLKDGKFNIENSVETKPRSYISAVFYNGEIYFASDKSVYRLKDNLLEEYVKLVKDDDSYEQVTSMSFDKNGVLYVVSKENIYVVDKNKKVEAIELSAMNAYGNVKYNNLVKDNNGQVYLITGYSTKVKLTSLDGTQYRTINYKSQSGEEPVNIFLNENDEFEFVYGDKTNGYRVYELDENLLPQEDKRFNNQGSGLMETYNEIKGIEKTADRKLILWIGNNMLYMKEKDKDKFIGLYDIDGSDNITSMVDGKDGKVYIGTYNSGVLSYGEKLNILPKDYENKLVEEKAVVGNHKEWTIKFNIALDKNTINEENITVVNSVGEKHDVKVTLESDNTSIKITPNNAYENGEIYYIIVKETIKSLSGKSLVKPAVGKFIVSTETEDNGESAEEVEFKVIEPENLDVRQKSFMDFIIDSWRSSFKGKVGQVTVENVNVGMDTAVISFNAEVLVEKNDKTIKEIQTVTLNCKKIDGVWKILE